MLFSYITLRAEAGSRLTVSRTLNRRDRAVAGLVGGSRWRGDWDVGRSDLLNVALYLCVGGGVEVWRLRQRLILHDIAAVGAFWSHQVPQDPYEVVPALDLVGVVMSNDITGRDGAGDDLGGAWGD